MPGTYERDFYAWANEQAALLRAGRLSEADIANIAEEIESMGRTERRELVNRLIVLLSHLLKWRFQPTRRSAGWEVAIRNQRRALVRHLADNPSLRSWRGEALAEAYLDARGEAYAETGLPEAVFPANCPWTFEEALDPDLWPEAAA